MRSDQQVASSTYLPFWSHMRVISILVLFYLMPDWSRSQANFRSSENPVPIDTIVLGTTAQYPISSEDRSGVLDQFMFEAFRRCGYFLKVVHLPAERSLIDANSGKIDGDLNRICTIGAQYPNLIKVPEKNLNIKFVAITKGKDVTEISFKELFNYDVGIIRGWKIFENNLRNHPSLIKVGNAELLFNLLQVERVDFILYSRPLAVAYLEHLGDPQLEIVPTPLVEMPMHVFLNKKHINLLDTLANTMREMKVESHYQQLFSLIR